MRRGAAVCGVAALAAILGTSMLSSASASELQKIGFTSSPPSPAVAGGSNVVTATSSSGEPAQLYPGGACSFTNPGSEDQIEVRRRREKEPARKPHQSPQTVYLVGAGTCKIQTQTDVSQSFAVAKDTAERVTFTTQAPSHPLVGGSYRPHVRSSARVDVSFAVATRSVCEINGALVSFRAAGTCTIDVRQAGSSESEAPEARQSFAVGVGTSATGSACKGSFATGRIPMTVCSELLKEALSFAGRREDSHPYDIQIVLTTNEKLIHTIGAPPPLEASAYVVAMRGHFKPLCKKGRPKNTLPRHECSGSVLMLVIRASTEELEAWTEPERYPNLAALGTPVRLTPEKADAAPA